MAYTCYFQRGVLLLLTILELINGSLADCSPRLLTKGVTVPAGDIVIEHGKTPLEIICVIDDEKYLKNESNPSRLLYFTTSGGTNVTENVEILNATSIRLYDKNVPISNNMYTCMLENEAVCLNKVMVGTKPAPVEDFSCISNNYDNLTCTWSCPNNHVETNYTLLYTFKGRAGRNPNECPNLKYLNDEKSRMQCFWNGSSTPHYRQVQAFYNFVLTARNTFGNNTINYTFDHFKYVKPAPPEKLDAVNATDSSILLKWNIHGSLVHFEPGLQYRILYQCEHGPKDWKLADIKDTRNVEVYYNLTGLRPHDLCDIRVSLRSNKSDEESMWSSNSSITNRTNSAVPGGPPRTTIGSFELRKDPSNLTMQKVYIYWQQISEEMKNGEEFHYNVTPLMDFSGVELVETKNSYALFQKLLSYREYKFLVWSANSEGKSVNHSVVTIPASIDRPGSPGSFTKIAYDGGKYALVWEHPKTTNVSIKNYTIFWCKNSKDRPFQCVGYLNWTEVPNNITRHEVIVNESSTAIWQFAIAANSEYYSSGMVWAGCTLLHDKSVEKIKQVYKVSAKETSIKLGWKLDCINGFGKITEFIIYYCPIVSPFVSNCKEPQQNVTFEGNSTTKNGVVTGLKPYTTYMLSVSFKTMNGDISEPSDIVYETTLEDAPSKPQNTKVREVTNSSMRIIWGPPAERNGALKYYEIRYNNESVIVDVDASMSTHADAKTYNYTLRNLTSYKTYNVSVAACTTFCSEPAFDPVQPLITTMIGKPGSIKKPRVSFQNNSYILVDWERPSQPNGLNDYYKVHLIGKSLNGYETREMINITGTQYSIVDCGQDDKGNTFHIKVRAVNIYKHEHLLGPWSDPLECYCSNNSKFVMWVVLVTIISLIVLVVGVGLKKCFNCCNDMRNVELKLPPGLTPIPEWGPQKGQEEPDTIPPADEELLLTKMDNHISSGDSSGCSSGHESVASETGTTFSSTSDSGTEQNELRKRSRNNISSPIRTTTNTGYVTMPNDPAVMPRVKPSTGNYCVLGVDPNSPTQSDNFMKPSPHDSPKLPYITPESIMVNDLNKPSISGGYVPLNYPEIEKHPSYVLAGTKNMLIPDQVKSKVEDKLYVQVSDANKGLAVTNTWLPPADNIVSKGYVTIGDALPPTKRTTDTSKGYVPHRHFDSSTSKLFKED